VKKCNNCGAEQPDDSLFCGQCGFRLDNIKNGIPGPMPEKKDVSREDNIDTGNVNDVPEPNQKPTPTMLPPTDRFASADQNIGKPVEPVESVTSAEPVASVESAEPVVPVEPVVSVSESIEMVEPAEPAEQPVEQPTEPVESVEQPAEPVEPVESVEQPVSAEALLDQAKPVAPKKSNKSLKIVLVAVCVVLVIVCIAGFVIANFNTGKNKKSNNSSSNSSQQVQQNTNNNSAQNDTVAAAISGWEFLIPQTYDYRITGDTLVIYGNDNAWAARISYDGSEYANIASNLDAIQQSIANKGYRITRSGSDAYGGSEYYWFDVDIEQTGEKGVFAITQAPDTGTFTIVLVDVDGTQDHSMLTEISDIINSAMKSNN